MISSFSVSFIFFCTTFSSSKLLKPYFWYKTKLFGTLERTYTPKVHYWQQENNFILTRRKIYYKEKSHPEEILKTMKWKTKLAKKWLYTLPWYFTFNDLNDFAPSKTQVVVVWEEENISNLNI